eukprot:CAMPEP_0171461842 /NCGR_PEP_ID=MMETSP0945-20130129/6124_1 /TAXON_ID=109269 /ORGANISM="Vaucheria litorea, Strain CCMP2940" /LENGTH=395 /DNA_ID=CAMNT_0011988261 /DNA_START=40 /DNA_END=1227 /DNA_ORIENTATION=+
MRSCSVFISLLLALLSSSPVEGHWTKKAELNLKLKNGSKTEISIQKASAIESLRGGGNARKVERGGNNKKIEKVVTPVKVVPAESKLLYNLRIGSYFFLWYSLNVGYNYHNKKTLNMISAPLTLSALQLVVGVVYVGLLWLFRLRSAPGLSIENIKVLNPIGFCHAASHLSAVVGLGAGSVSFAHIVKAMEPFFTALFSAIFLKQFFPLPVYASLIPVVAGVALASLKELNFSIVALGGAMGSNVAAASRAILAKKSMSAPKGTNMGPANLYGVLTIIATIVLVPIAAILEGPKIMALWDAAVSKGFAGELITRHALLSGLYFYLYNEVAFLALDAVHPVVHAVGNTLKRVFVIASGVILFGNQITPLGLVGSALAIVGVLVFSLVKEYYSNKKV